MGRILFGSEFGANLGHIYPMMRIADKLEAKGHEIIFAARNVPHTYGALKDTNYKLIQAPYWSNPTSPRLQNVFTPSYSDVMARQGFMVRDRLAAYATGWADLVETISPDLIIADHSPGLSMAVRDVVPMINMGNGFTLPPSEIKRYPPVISSGDPLISQTLLLKIFNSVLKELGRPLLNRLPEIFDTPGQFICTVPILDPYSEIRKRTLVGPIEDSMAREPLPKEQSIFLYMAGEAGNDNVVLEAIKRVGVKANVFLRAAPEKTFKQFHSKQINMLREPADFSQALPEASLIIHAGGGGTSTACLMTGRPQITFPTHSETALNSRLMHKAGVARVVKPAIDLTQMTDFLKYILSEQALFDRAQKVAQELSEGDWHSALDKIVKKSEELLTSS